MKSTSMKHLATFILIITLCQLVQAGTVSTIPEHSDHNLVVALDDMVTFIADSDNGTVTATISADDPAAQCSEGNDPSQTVTFGTGCEGKMITVTFTVTHETEEEMCTESKDFTYKVYVPKIEATEEDLWYINNFSQTEYENITTVSVTPALPDVDTYTWGFDTSTRSFKLNGEDVSTKNTSEPTLDMTTKSFSPEADDNILTCEFAGSGGTIKITKTFTVRAPRTISCEFEDDHDVSIPAGPPAYVAVTGFESIYKMTIKDQFAQPIPRQMAANESFGSRYEDYTFNNWPTGTPNGGTTAANDPAVFKDTYGVSMTDADALPDVRAPGTLGSATKVYHQDQYYKVCSETVGEGILLESHFMQIYRGQGRQE